MPDIWPPVAHLNQSIVVISSAPEYALITMDDGQDYRLIEFQLTDGKIEVVRNSVERIGEVV